MISSASEIYEEQLELGRQFTRDLARSIKHFPKLPTGEPGLHVGWSVMHAYRMILHPDGGLQWYYSGQAYGDPHDYTYRGKVPDDFYVHDVTLQHIEQAVNEFKRTQHEEIRKPRLRIPFFPRLQIPKQFK